MMDSNMKKLLYTIGTVFVVFICVNLFIKIVPWLILIGLVTYIGFKINKFIKTKKSEFEKKKNAEYSNNQYSNTSYDSYQGKIIDVEYEEVEKDEYK